LIKTQVSHKKVISGLIFVGEYQQNEIFTVVVVLRSQLSLMQWHRCHQRFGEYFFSRCVFCKIGSQTRTDHVLVAVVSCYWLLPKHA